MRYVGLGIVVAALSLAGCSEGESEQQDIEPTTEKQGGEAPGADETGAAQGGDESGEGKDLGPAVESDSFTLVAQPAETYSAGELGQFAITVTGKGEWHVNQDFPTEVSIEAPASVDVPKKKLEKSDAAEFGEERARFDVPLTPGEAGEHRVEALVSFAMCTEETCVPKKQKLAVVLPVE